MKNKILNKLLLTGCIFFLYSAIAAQWRQTNGPQGMSVKTLFGNNNTLYAGTSAKGVFKSADNGITWHTANTGIESLTVFSIISNSNILFAGTTNGVYRSSNGTNWQQANGGVLQNKFINKMIVANGFLFAGTQGSGLFKTNNNGNTWTDANGGTLTVANIRALTFANPNLIVVDDNLIFYSPDNGNTWNYNPNAPFILGTNTELFSKGDSVLLADGPGIFRSFDAGVTWGKFISVSKTENILGFANAGGAMVAGTAQGTFASKNFGKTWNAIPASGLRTGYRFNNYFYASGHTLLLAFDEIGVALSNDGGRNWKNSLTGFMPAASIDNALLFSDNILLSGTHSDGLYKSTDNGNAWIKTGTTNDADTLSNGIIFSVLKNGNTIFAGTAGNGLYRSGDNGSTWARIRNGLPQKLGGYLSVNGLAKSSTNILAATDQGFYYSTDDGLSWHAGNIAAANGSMAGVAAIDSVVCVAVQRFTGGNKIYRSINNGVNFSEVFTLFGDDFICMATDGISHFYAGSFGGFSVSNNKGINWQIAGAGLPFGTGVYTLAAVNNNVFAGNDDGVYFSNNNGISFTQKSEGFDVSFGNSAVQGLGISPQYVFAGLFQNSVWKRPLSDFGIVNTTVKPGNKNEKINLSLYPTMVSSNATLSYSLNKEMFVKITLFNAAGLPVKNIVHEKQQAGSYNFSISRDGLYAGIYTIKFLGENTAGEIKFIVQ